MEREDEIAGLGNVYTTANRNYDARTARWFSLDPAKMKYLSQSPFNAFGNNPVIFKDPGGDDIYFFNETYEVKKASGQMHKVVNGDMTFYLQLPDQVEPESTGDHEYWFIKNGFVAQINSPYTLHGGDGNDDVINQDYKQYVRHYNYDLDDMLKNGIIQNTIDKYYSTTTFDHSFLEMPLDGLFALFKVANFGWKSRNGKDLDYKAQLPILQHDLKNGKDGLGTLYSIDGVLYNQNEAGNFLWGYTASALGYPLKMVKAGAELFIDIKDFVIWAGNYFQKSEWMDHDEPWEVTAFIKGYAYQKMQTLEKDSEEYNEYKQIYENASERYDYYEGSLDSTDDSTKEEQ